MNPRIFLDFDGVLRRNDSPRDALDADCLERLEACLSQHADVRVVISSTWRHAMSLAALRRLFGPSVADRIEGVTPDHSLEDCEHLRHSEILAYLRAKGASGDPWLAIDDQPDAFPAGAPVLSVDASLGFDEAIARRLCEWMSEVAAPAGAPGEDDLDFVSRSTP